MQSTLPKDSNGAVIQRFSPNGTPQTLTVNGSSGAATLSAAIDARWVRMTCTQPTFVLPTVAGDVTASTGHYLAANTPYDIDLLPGNTKVSVLGATATAGVCYLSELGNY